MTETWTISAGGRTYGPFTVQQMQGFAAEGRLAPHSLIARVGTETHVPASNDPLISPIFSPVQATQEKIAQSFGAVQSPTVTVPVAAEATPHRFGRNEAEPQSSERSRFIIIADMKSNSLSGLEEEIFNLGPAYAIQPQAWVLASELSISDIRTRLLRKLGKLDMLFLVDATRDKAAWFGFGPESEARIRRILQKSPEQIQSKRTG